MLFPGKANYHLAERQLSCYYHVNDSSRSRHVSRSVCRRLDALTAFFLSFFFFLMLCARSCALADVFGFSKTTNNEKKNITTSSCVQANIIMWPINKEHNKCTSDPTWTKQLQSCLVHFTPVFLVVSAPTIVCYAKPFYFSQHYLFRRTSTSVSIKSFDFSLNDLRLT